MGNDVIVKFKKTASADDKAKILEDIKSKGGQVVKDENVGSSIFPFAVVNMSPDAFSSLQSLASGHDVIDHVEEDKVMHTQ